MSTGPITGSWISVQAAIESCPVECISWVQKQQLPALEYVMQRKITARPNVAVMMSGSGPNLPDVFTASQLYLKRRKEKCALPASSDRNLQCCNNQSFRHNRHNNAVIGPEPNPILCQHTVRARNHCPWGPLKCTGNGFPRAQA